MPKLVTSSKIKNEGVGFWTNWPQAGQRNYSQFGNNFDQYFNLSQIGKQCKPVQVYKFVSSVNRALFTTFAHALVGAASPIPFEHHLAMMAARSF